MSEGEPVRERKSLSEIRKEKEEAGEKVGELKEYAEAEKNLNQKER